MLLIPTHHFGIDGGHLCCNESDVHTYGKAGPMIGIKVQLPLFQRNLEGRKVPNPLSGHFQAKSCLIKAN